MKSDSFGMRAWDGAGRGGKEAGGKGKGKGEGERGRRRNGMEWKERKKGARGGMWEEGEGGTEDPLRAKLTIEKEI